MATSSVLGLQDIQLELDIRTNSQGQKVLHFDFMDISDLHLGTRHSRAKKTSHMMQHTEADIFRLGGDEVDGTYMRRKKTWHFAPWHRQMLGHILRKVEQGSKVTKVTSNHDVELRGKKLMREGREVWHRKLSGKKLYGIDIVDEDLHQDIKGRQIQVLHGDEPFDNVVFGSHKGFWYGVGDVLHAGVAHLDTWVQDIPGFEGKSLAAASKRLVKTIINEFMGVNKEITRAVDENPLIDGLIYGHSHMGDISRTPKGKLLLNSGCCTEHVQAIVQDRHGTFALITWHKDRLDIQEENGKKRTVLWDDIGLSSFKADPVPVEDESTQKADRLIRLIFRMWSPKDRRHEVKEAHEQGLAVPPIPLPPPRRGGLRRGAYQEATYAA